MNLRVITPPAVEPVSVETAKSHLRVDTANDDALITLYIKVAREKGEGLARRAFITQTLELVVDKWPSDSLLRLPRSPLQSVTSVKYLDDAGDERTHADYQVDARSEPGKIFFKSFPSQGLFPSGAIAVRFVAGYGAAATAVPSVFIQGILMLVGHWYENREAVTGNNFQAYEVPLGPKELFLSDRARRF